MPPPESRGGASSGTGLTLLGKLVSFLLIVGLIALGVFVFTRSRGGDDARPRGGDYARKGDDTTSGTTGTTTGAGGESPAEAAPEELAETQTSVPTLDAP